MQEMKELAPDETFIEGQWLFDEQVLIADDACERIKWLVSKVLEKGTIDKSGWEILYKDPKDNRLWIHYYPQSEMQGGGPPALRVISYKEAQAKFGV